MSLATLDDSTAERLLRGALPPDDAPPGYSGVVTLLDTARTEARTATSARTEDTITAMVAASRVRPIPVVPRRRPIKAKVATAASAGLLTLSGMAAAGALPSVAQRHIATVLAKVGIEVPRGERRHGRSPSSAHTPRADDTGGVGATTNHGDCVSQVAGSGRAQVSAVAQSDCRKPASAGGSPADATRDAVPPSQAKTGDNTQPTQPTPANSGGSDDDGHEGTGPGNGHSGGGTPSPTGLANGFAQAAHEPHSATSSPRAPQSTPTTGQAH
jgi:hypothetical protein